VSGAPRAAELAEALLGLPHVQPLDRLAAEEIGALMAQRAVPHSRDCRREEAERPPVLAAELQARGGAARGAAGAGESWVHEFLAPAGNGLVHYPHGR
jgi:hypothetical protein